MPKELTRAMKHPYARTALRMLRRKLNREPTLSELQSLSKELSFFDEIKNLDYEREMFLSIRRRCEAILGKKITGANSSSQVVDNHSL